MNSMSPFAISRIDSKPTLWARVATKPGLFVFLFCLLAGLAAVAWRAKAQGEFAHTQARNEAVARAALLELQFSRALTAAEVLGALSTQTGGAIPNFQKVATELLAARPGLNRLELQPGGVVSDIVPRAGNQRAIGFNVL
jgi:hypothetical protein